MALKNRIISFFAVFMLMLFLSLVSVFKLSSGTELAETAVGQSTYTLTVSKTRGTIYDCNGNPLTGTEQQLIAAISPTTEAMNLLSEKLPEKEVPQLYEAFTSGIPFLWKLPHRDIICSDIDIFEVDTRYSEQQTAAHVIGYLDGSGTGVSGIEKAYDGFLSADQGEISVSYQVDALGHVLAGAEHEITDTSDAKDAGVVLTLDRDIQAAAEEAAEKYLEKGAVIVTEAPTGEIRAMVSMPGFSPSDVSDYLDRGDSPLLNRAMSAYNVGSVFKLVAAAAALEAGADPGETYECTGQILVSGDPFHCYNGIAHGEVNMQEAIAQSCNTYFIQLMEDVPQKDFLAMAQKLGFGESAELAPEYWSAAGCLPDLSQLSIPKALANFSFGQGDLMATPLQIAGLINTIASGGVYREPYLVKGTVDSSKTFLEQNEPDDGTRVFSEETASLLRQYMGASVSYGTGKKGKPTLFLAGAKTGTAQTGIMEGEREVVQGWYAGFYPLEDPQYSIVVLAEDSETGGGDCAPVFCDIADALALKIN